MEPSINRESSVRATSDDESEYARKLRIRNEFVRGDNTDYNSITCPCENNPQTVLYNYKVNGPLVTYESSDEDEEIIIQAGITARAKIAAKIAAKRSSRASMNQG